MALGSRLREHRAKREWMKLIAIEPFEVAWNLERDAEHLKRQVLHLEWEPRRPRQSLGNESGPSRRAEQEPTVASEVSSFKELAGTPDQMEEAEPGPSTFLIGRTLTLTPGQALLIRRLTVNINVII